MCFWKDPRLGSRTLRFKDRGPDVNQLHELLRSQGYDLGEEPDYGYLTKDAVRQFQREHGLIADGIAGARFFALALAEDLPIRRQMHVVQPGETLAQIAADYKVQPQALGRGRLPAQIYAGQRLLFFDREIWGICSNSLPENIEASRLTGLIVTKTAQEGRGFPHIISPESDPNDVQHLCGLLRSRKIVKQTSAAMLKMAQGAAGLYLPWRHMAGADGARYLSLLKRLRKELPPAVMLWVQLGPGIPPWRIWGGLDYEAVGALADRIVVALPPAQQPGPILNKDKLEAALCTLRPYVPSWKTLVQIPVYAALWEIGDGEEKDGGEYFRLPYQTARSRAFRHGARLARDEERGSYYFYQSRGRRFEIWLPQYGVFGDVCAVINRCNLAGVILDRLGMEDPRLWETLVSYFRPARL